MRIIYNHDTDEIKMINLVEDEKKTEIKNYKKANVKSLFPKRILKTLTIIAVYELSKYVTNEIITRRQANDTIDQYPMDYEVSE
ncbi:transcriptional activator RinB [Staphylococcus carnosus]|uniref:transcriptional activator RinB n=1 Tax=Staphylococcus carnosus TaxID=1281 RepID=UPI00081A6524|nr:hypothetical protein [Staphylococcus carnosus]ANZ33061.1 hypothetical protein BEK99_04250 [Staphylococcus carnosus]UTB85199.1 hypothetical protein A2I66_05855 [Staphylococcus carnosus]